MSFLQLVCQNVPGGARMVEESGGLEAIDDVHYSGQVSAARGTQGMARALRYPFLSVEGHVVLVVLRVCRGNGGYMNRRTARRGDLLSIDWRSRIWGVSISRTTISENYVSLYRFFYLSISYRH